MSNPKASPVLPLFGLLVMDSRMRLSFCLNTTQSWFPPMLGGSCILALFFPTHGTLLMTEERRPAIWAIYGTMGASSSSSLATMRLPHCSLHSVPRASKSLIIVAGEM
ncbi:uncharacterized protein LOC123426219 isoform X1 [Hordeum vulgare subsp. vulgare]|uniref:uncharacterized protein LOC123426219 isoform X1 n=1 Tax=Hordeum vulgare subsp. vulgare TaxID=112509 RepID=UPI001D1A55F7|nr:uncharacterized protein LOC123426219 isoform X1 [Hordeum vulgare subsp. vulgare]